jgi:peptidoglycan/xylan/chitin deacetylase (PgdA/CDA1 family)
MRPAVGLVNVLLALVVAGSWLLGVPASAAASCAYHVPILVYHQIDGLFGRPSPALFEEQMQALYSAGWRTITMRELAGRFDRGYPVPARRFVVTIDDGYADAYTQVAPILEHRAYRAVFYISTSFPGRTGRVTWDQVRALDARGHDIGNHAVHHRRMAGLSYADQYAEWSGASNRILAETGRRPRSAAYPGGSYDETTLAVLRALPNHRFARSGLPPPFCQTDTDRFEQAKIGPATRTGPQLVKALEPYA